MKGAHKRKDFQISQFQKLGLDVSFMDATTPNEIPDLLVKYKNSWARPLRDAEIALTHSHLRAWHYSIKKKKPALILEDDVVLCASLPLILKTISARMDLELVQLETYNQPKLLGKNSEILNAEDYHLHRLYRDRGGAAAYFIWPETAEKLTSSVQETYPPADAAIHLAPQIIRHQTSPACAIQAMHVQRGAIDFERVLEIAPSSVSNTPKPEYESRMQWLKCKKRRLIISIILLRRIFAGIFSAEYMLVRYTGR